MVLTDVLTSYLLTHGGGLGGLGELTAFPPQTGVFQSGVVRAGGDRPTAVGRTARRLSPDIDLCLDRAKSALTLQHSAGSGVEPSDSCTVHSVSLA